MQQSKNVSGKKHRKKGILSYFCKFCQADHKLRFSSRPISRYGGGGGGNFGQLLHIIQIYCLQNQKFES